MINSRVINWRCIEDVEFKLGKINVFIGPNSTGKSSLAYAIYFTSKSSRSDPQYLLNQLYGCDFSGIARLMENTPQYPISIRVNSSEFSVKLAELKETEGPKSKFEISRPSSSPWTDEFLLPSRRISYVQIMMLLPRIISGLRGKPEFIFIGSLIGGLMELFKTLPLFPPFSVFAIDYTRALTGLRLELLRGELKDIGSYIVNILPLVSLIELVVQDPYINQLRLTPEMAPDGLLDFSIFDSMTQKIPENSLVVIEEPEIHKNPLMVVEFTEHIVKRALDKKLTLVLTTHSDIPLLTIGKLVMNKVLRAEDVKIYYFRREPWTKLSEIKVYEDGTLEGLPEVEKLITYLF